MSRFVIFILLFITVFSSDICSQTFAGGSVLAEGKWFRIAITEDGVYRIDYSILRQLGLENPSDPKVFGNNWGQLSYYNNNPKPDDLKELSVFISGDNSVLDEGEYLLFYGKAANRWIYNDTTRSYSFLHHNYSDTAFYFLTSGSQPGKRITARDSSLITNGTSIASDALFIHEVDAENLRKSGREWFQPVGALSGLTINPGFTHLITSEKIRYRIRVAARAEITTTIRLNEGNSLVKNIQVPPVNLYNTTGTYANISEQSDSLLPGSVSPVFELKYLNNGVKSENAAWLDYLSLQGRITNRFNGSQWQFSDSRSAAPGSITEFRILSSNSNAVIWDITDPWNVKQILYKKTGETISFRDSSFALKTYIAFTTSTLVTPYIKPSAIPNQNLHGSPPADMIIVSHPLFVDYARKLADIHLNSDGLVSLIVTPEQIYNEFSGGIPDIAAIRNFVRFKYLTQISTDKPLKYLLLFGDGSYENKALPPNNPNFIPTYQSQNSNVVVSSFTSDDFYGLLEDNEGEAEGSEDIGIGRLPVSDTIQAGIIISKIQNYLDPDNMGEWKNIICLTADDEDGNTHLSDAEGLARLLQDSVPSFNIDKIYLDAFRQTTTVNGQSYPNVNQAINDRINAGCLIFNYVGHGGESGLAHEMVLKTEDINSWRNTRRLPLFITATCEFSRFDDVEKNSLSGGWTGRPSAGEMVLLNSKAGAIALMSTTRVVYSAPNHFLNRNIFNFAFDRDKNGNSLTFGDIIRLAKNNSGSGPNKRNFTLLGDPALKLAYPWHGNVITDSVNSVAVEDKIDSLKALSLITVSGHLEDISGNLMDDFDGIVSPLVFDKENRIKTLANDGGQSIEFPFRNNILFSGNTMAEEGKFRFTFIVPRDIDYSFGNGKISYYAAGNNKDMQGQFSEIIVGGFSNAVTDDTKGPDIKLYMNDTLFENGGITNSNPVLLAILEDRGGINTTGSGIGHDLTAFLDNKQNNAFVLNQYYETDFDNYMRGSIVYDLSGLEEGSHTLTLKAWDNFNNSSVKTLLFVVETDGKFLLKNLINYPNPFLDETRIKAEHNRPDDELDITITIYNLSGTAVKTIRTKVTPAGFSLPPVEWDGKDDRGNRLAGGMYPYSVIVATSSGEITRASGRMIILKH